MNSPQESGTVLRINRPINEEAHGEPLIGRVSIDDWIRGGGRAEFKVSIFSEQEKEGPNGASISFSHNGNSVFAHAGGQTCAEAFLLAIQKIERTIGQGWRRK